MEHRSRQVDNALLLEEYRTLLATVPQLPLLVSGGSMTPFLVHGRDTVFLTKVSRPLQRGDIVLYQRNSGAYVLHRIYAVEDGTFAMVGDAQTLIEHGITAGQIFAVVCAVQRKGCQLAPGSFWWEFFAKVWIRIVPARPTLMRLYGGIRKVFRR